PAAAAARDLPARHARGHELRAGRENAQHPGGNGDVAPLARAGEAAPRAHQPGSPAQGQMKMAAAFPVSEAELQAYVDGRAGAARRGAIEAWLAAHPEDAQRVVAYRQLGEQWREAYAAVLDEPVPPELLDALEERPRRSRLVRAAGALGVAALLALAVSLYLAPSPPSPIVQRSAIAHSVYAAEAQHPVEARAKSEVLAWLSERLHM